MNFFKSILSDDPDPQNPQESEPNSPPNPSQITGEGKPAFSDQSFESPKSNPKPNSSSSDESGTIPTTTTGGGWSFGGLIKTFATRSESMLETYRRDLHEFGSGLRKETEIIREVASRAVKELPASIEVGVSKAHGSLESFNQAIDGVIKSTAEIITDRKETMLSSSDVEPDTPDTRRVSSSGRYSRFDAQLSAIQNDLNTFCEEPDDIEEFKKWKSGFSLEEKSEEIENLIGENGVLEHFYKKVVPNVVDSETFWSRYFYRVHKLKQQESVRANLVKRAIPIDDEEELSWDVDDDDDNEEEKTAKSKAGELEREVLGDPNSAPISKHESTSDESHNVGSGVVNEKGKDKSSLDEVFNETGVVSETGEDKSSVDDVAKGNVVVSNASSVSAEKAKPEESSELKNEHTENKGDECESGKDSDVSIVSSQPTTHEADDLGWDEIEDIGSDDDKKATTGTRGGSPKSAHVRKQLSTGEEDEYLNWDIEDDDESVKS